MDSAHGMPPLRLRIDLAYVGTQFSGWQIQPNRRTVQGDLADRLERLLQRTARPVGAGRTDAGVHARGQVAHVDVRTADEARRVCRALPRLCPSDIEVLGAALVSPAFDARMSALSRRYSYRLQLRRNLFAPFAFHVPWPLDRAAMQVACASLLGVHDFSSFCKAGSLKLDNHCRVDLCRLEWLDDSGILHIRADRFLHHMVRNIVGLLIDVGRGRRKPADLDRILQARDRCEAGAMAPAHGLFLEEVSYPSRLMDPGFLPDHQPVEPAPPGAAGEGDEQ